MKPSAHDSRVWVHTQLIILHQLPSPGISGSLYSASSFKAAPSSLYSTSRAVRTPTKSPPSPTVLPTTTMSSQRSSLGPYPAHYTLPAPSRPYPAHYTPPAPLPQGHSHTKSPPSPAILPTTTLSSSQRSSLNLVSHTNGRSPASHSSHLTRISCCKRLQRPIIAFSNNWT